MSREQVEETNWIQE